MNVIGLPKEIKVLERRVALTPGAVGILRAEGFEVHVQRGAGEGAGYADSDFVEHGAVIVESAEDAWRAGTVVKVKEPQPEEVALFRDGLRLFCYLHLAGEPKLARALVDAGVEAYAFETLEHRGGLPLLSPMSEIAGRATAIVAARLLSSESGGSGVLMGGAVGAPPAKVLVIGMGVAGQYAARGSRGLDAQVYAADVNLERLREVRNQGIATATAVSHPDFLRDIAPRADVVFGCALIPGGKAPVVLREDTVAKMRPGSVIVDIAIDQGGCIETAHPTTLAEPTYVKHGVIHYCVTNIPGQYPRTATQALSAAITPWAGRIAGLKSYDGPIGDAALDTALNVARGEIIHPQLKRDLLERA